MKRILLTSAGLTERTKPLFAEAIHKDMREIRIVLIPDAAFVSDSAREGLLVAMAELLAMGIRPDNIFVYYLNSLLSDHYQRTYSSYVDEMNRPPVFRLFTDALRSPAFSMRSASLRHWGREAGCHFFRRTVRFGICAVDTKKGETSKGATE